MGTLAALIVLGGCSGDSDRGTDSSAADEGGGELEAQPQTESPGEARRDTQGEGDGSVDPSGLEGTVPVAQDRDLIRTGYMRIEVDDIDEAVADVRSITGDAEGFVASEEIRASSEEATMTLRIPADTFDAVREDLSGLGEVTSRDSETEDVTEELVDLESRIDSMRASIGRLRDLFENATSIEDLTHLEQELAAREADLESLLGRQRDLQDQVALSTLTVELDVPPVVQEDPDVVDDDDDLPSFLDGLGLGWKVIVTAVRIALAVTGFLLPFLVPAIALAIVLRWLFRRRRRTLEAPPRR